MLLLSEVVSCFDNHTTMDEERATTRKIYAPFLIRL